jgi:hypothetical protein
MSNLRLPGLGALLACVLLLRPIHAESGYRACADDATFNSFVVYEPRPTILFVYSLDEARCQDCAASAADYQLAAAQAKGYVRFAAVDVDAWPAGQEYLKARLGLDPEKYPLPNVVLFGAPSAAAEGRPARMYNGPRNVDGFRQLAASALPAASEVPVVASRADLDKLQALDKHVVVLFSNKPKPTPLVRAASYALSSLATLAICDASDLGNENLPALGASLNLTFPDDLPSLLVLPRKSFGFPARFAANLTIEGMLQAVSKTIAARNKPVPPKSAKANSSSASKPKPKAAAAADIWGLVEDAGRLEAMLRTRFGVVLAARSGDVNESTPAGWAQAQARLTRVGQQGLLVHCNASNATPYCASLPARGGWTFRVFEHARAAGPAGLPPATGSLEAAVDKCVAGLGGDIQQIPKDVRKEYFGVVARDWSDPAKGHITLLLFGRIPDTRPLFALSQALPELFLVHWFPDATSQDLQDLGVTDDRPLPVLAGFLPMLEDPVPAKGYTFKIAFYDLQQGAVEFGPLASFALGLMEAVDKKRLDAVIDAGGLEDRVPHDLAGAFRQRRQREIDAVPKTPPVAHLASAKDVDELCASTCVLALIPPGRSAVVHEAQQLAQAQMLGHVQFAWLDGPCNYELVNRMGLDPAMLPTVVAWNNKKKLVSAQMRGAFAKEELVGFAKLFKAGKVKTFTAVPGGLAPIVCAQDSDQAAAAAAGGEEEGMDELMAEMRAEAEREDVRKQEVARQALLDAKRLKEQRDAEAKKRREEMNVVADQEAKKQKQAAAAAKKQEL